VRTVIDVHAAINWRFFMLMLGAHEEAYASAALFVALGRKLIDKKVINLSKEEVSGIVDQAGALPREFRFDASSVSTSSLASERPWDRRCDKGPERLGDVDGQKLGS
jgi:hypothetical protein